MSRKGILLTSAGSKVPLLRALEDAARRVIPEAIVYPSDSDALAPVAHLSDTFWHSPLAKESFFVKWIGGLVERGINLIIPSRDEELAFWATHENDLRQHSLTVLSSSAISLERCTDKLVFSEWGTSLGLPVISSSVCLEEIPSGPMVVKERRGSGSRGVFLRPSADETKAVSAFLKEPIYQPFIEGMEISVDAYVAKSGAVHGLVLRRRDRVRNGESEVTTTFRDSFLESEAKKVIAAYELWGPIVMQAIVSRTGWHVIEINPRFGGASTISAAVGLDSLAWAVQEVFFPGKKLPRFCRKSSEARQVRFSQDTVLPWS